MNLGRLCIPVQHIWLAEHAPDHLCSSQPRPGPHPRTCSSWPLAFVVQSALVSAGQAEAWTPRVTCILQQEVWRHTCLAVNTLPLPGGLWAAAVKRHASPSPHQQRLSLSKRQATMASTPLAGAGLYWHTPVQAPAMPPPITAPKMGEPE